MATVSNVSSFSVVQAMQVNEYVEMEQPPPTKEKDFLLAISSGNAQMIVKTLQQKQIREILLDPKKGARAFVFKDGGYPLHKLAKNGIDLAMQVFLDFCLENSCRLEVREEVNKLNLLSPVLNAIVFAYTGGDFFIISGIGLRDKENRTPLSLSIERVFTEAVFHAICATLLLKYGYTPDQINITTAISSVEKKLKEVRKSIRNFQKRYPTYSCETGGKEWLRIWKIDEDRLDMLLTALYRKSHEKAIYRT